jgi:hypothetical protein
MTKGEAQLEIMMGNKVTHRYFDNNEFIKKTIDLKFLEDEKGKLLNAFEFWYYRQAPHFNDGWELFTEQNKEVKNV